MFAVSHLQAASWSGVRGRKMCLRIWWSSPSCSWVTKSKSFSIYENCLIWLQPIRTCNTSQFEHKYLAGVLVISLDWLACRRDPMCPSCLQGHRRVVASTPRTSSCLLGALASSLDWLGKRRGTGLLVLVTHRAAAVLPTHSLRRLPNYCLTSLT